MAHRAGMHDRRLRLPARHCRADRATLVNVEVPTVNGAPDRNSAAPLGSKLARRFTKEGLRGIDEGIGELAVLHKLADMAIEGRADRPELCEMNVSPAGLDPVIGQARHAEDAGRGFLGKPQHASPAP